MIPTPQEVISEFGFLTGITIRIASHGQQAQAIEFCKHFTLKDLADVIGWIQKKIASGDKRMDERSLSWRNVMGEYGSGNEFSTFQDRLAMAQKTVRVRPPVRQIPTARQVDATSVIVRFEPDPEPATDSIAAETARQLRGLRDGLRGGAL